MMGAFRSRVAPSLVRWNHLASAFQDRGLCASGLPRVLVARLADSSSPLSADTSGENIAESLVAEGLASRREGIRANKYVCGCVPALPR